MPKHLTKDFQEKLKEFDQKFNATFGAGAIDQDKKIIPYDVLPTGSIALDIAYGVGGYVVGRLHEVYGNPDIGKSSLALLACAEAQKKWNDRMVAYIDVENKMDSLFAEAHGVDRTQWRLYKPKNAEDVADSLKYFLTEPMFSLVVIDSVGAMIGKVEQEKEAGQDVVAIVARIVTRMVKIANSYAESNHSVVLINNQVRSDISRFSAGLTTPGGWGLKFATTTQSQVRLTKTQPLTAIIKGEKIPVAREVAVSIKRNKVAPKGATAIVLLHSVDSKHGPVGVDRADEAAVIGIKLGVIRRSGHLYTFPGGQVVDSAAKVKEHLRLHPKEIETIRTACLASNTVYVQEVDEEPDAPDPDINVDEETGEILPPVLHLPSRERLEPVSTEPLPIFESPYT